MRQTKQVPADEVVRLRAKVDELKSINDTQLERLSELELLKIRIVEQEAMLDDLIDEKVTIDLLRTLFFRLEQKEPKKLKAYVRWAARRFLGLSEPRVEVSP